MVSQNVCFDCMDLQISMRPQQPRVFFNASEAKLFCNKTRFSQILCSPVVTLGNGGNFSHFGGAQCSALLYRATDPPCLFTRLCESPLLVNSHVFSLFNLGDGGYQNMPNQSALESLKELLGLKRLPATKQRLQTIPRPPRPVKQWPGQGLAHWGRLTQKKKHLEDSVSMRKTHAVSFFTARTQVALFYA